jgi:GTP-binding protein
VSVSATNAEYYASYGKISQLPPSDESARDEIVFIGRSNVGKSSLINALCRRKNLARTSAQPGKTATINFYRYNAAFLVDLPGYGYAKTSSSERARLAGLINGYLSAGRDIVLAVLLLDFRRAPDSKDIAMIDRLIEGEIPFAIALTKADKLSKKQREDQFALLKKQIPEADEILFFPCSAVNGEGVDELRNALRDVTAAE